MRLVFDTSALLNMVRFLGSDAVDYLRGGYILTLTPYEVGNALWKEAALLGRISVEEALSLLDYVASVYKLLSITAPRDALLTLKLAYELNVTYYDASYIVASHELNVGLVTDDEKLKRKIHEKRGVLTRVLGKSVTVYSTRELIESYGQPGSTC